MRACYDAVTNWGADVQSWLRDNLPDGTTAASLPDAPTFEYSRAQDTGRDLTHRIRDAFKMARSIVADPSASIDVAIGFHRPLTPSEVAAAIPSNATLQRAECTDRRLRTGRRRLARIGKGLHALLD